MQIKLTNYFYFDWLAQRSDLVVPVEDRFTHLYELDPRVIDFSSTEYNFRDEVFRVVLMDSFVEDLRDTGISGFGIFSPIGQTHVVQASMGFRTLSDAMLFKLVYSGENYTCI